MKDIKKFATTRQAFVHGEIQSDLGGLRFPVKGQGTVCATGQLKGSELVFKLLGTQPGWLMTVTITPSSFTVLVYQDGQLLKKEEPDDKQLFLEPEVENQAYWLSLDSNNARLRYGKGEPLRALMRYETTWELTSSVSEVAQSIQPLEVLGSVQPPVVILEMPVNLTPPPVVIPASELSLEIISANTASVVSDLPDACQILYNHVAGPGINLSPADFPEFAQAIQYSIVTPGGVCNTKLQEKDPIFGYLRVTLDPNLGDSPGQPYVLEIWPAGNGSPIHNHGHACAVIKVLHGQIQVAWYGALSPEITEPWGSMIAHAGQVTFLTPNYYQIHRLSNPSPHPGGDFCATIQCYRYPADDLTHYEYFDYVEKGEIKQFTPDSDWTYSEFKALIKAEWDAAMGASK